MKIIVTIGKEVIGTYNDYELAQRGVVQHFNKNFERGYLEKFRQVHMGEITKGKDVIDVFRYFENSDRSLSTPKHEVQFTYKDI